MFSVTMRVLQIKDLKDLSAFFGRGYYRHAGPKGPEEVSFTVGRGPVPRRASVGKTALAGVRFSRGSNDRGGQAPALRARKGFSSPCTVRDQAIPNYSHWGTRANAGACLPRQRVGFCVGKFC